MANLKIFISLDFDNNVRQKLVGQAKNSKNLFSITDWSSKERLPQKEWRKLIKKKINKCNLLIVVLLFLLLMPTGSLFAQYSAGIKAGIPFFNGNRFIGDYGINNTGTNYLGYFGVLNAGIFGQYSFKRNWSVRTEILYKNQGFGYQNQDNVVDTNDGTFNLNYLELPLLLQYEGQNEFRWFVQMGASFKFLTDAHHSYHHLGSQEGSVSIDGSENVKSVFNKLVLTANIGGGFIYDLPRDLFLLGELRLSYDITPLADNGGFTSLHRGDEWYFGNPRIFHMALSVGIGYKF